MKITIDYIKESPGQYGAYYSLKAGSTWYVCNKGDWNSTWKKGDVVEADAEQYTRKDGSVGWKLRAPKGAPTFTGPPVNYEPPAHFDKVFAELKAIRTLCEDCRDLLIDGKVDKEIPSTDGPPPPSDDDMPPEVF